MLIHNWRQFHKFWSVRLAALATMLQTIIMAFPDAALQAWLMLPQDLKGFVPPNYLQVISVGLLVLSIFVRIVQQPKLNTVPPVQPTEKIDER